MIPRQLSPGDDPRLTVFPRGFLLRYLFQQWSALTMNADHNRSVPEDGEIPQSPKATTVGDGEASEITPSLETELIDTPDSAPPNYCEFVPELPFPWNGAFLEWQKEFRNSIE